MSWINGLLIGAGEGLRRGSQTYFAERARRQERDDQTLDRIERQQEAVRRGVREIDELSERKRANKAQEGLEHERNVQSSLDRMLSRENARANSDEATRRAVETAMIRAASAERVAGMPARTPPKRPSAANPDGLTATQREGRLLIDRKFTNPQEKAEYEAVWTKARRQFPDADPGDVMTAVERYMQKIKAERGY